MRTSTLVSATAHLAVIAALLWTQHTLDAQGRSAVEQVEVLFVAPAAPAAGGGESAGAGPVRTGPHHARASEAPPAPAPSVDAPDDESFVETVEPLPTPDPPVTQQAEVEPPNPMPLPDSKPEALATPATPQPVEKEPEPAMPEPVPPAPAATPAVTQLAQGASVEAAPAPTTSGGSGVQSASLPSAGDDLPASTGGGEAGNGEVGPAGGGAAATDYAALLAAWLDDHKRYPERARRKHQEGVVVFEFAMDAQGRVIEHRILEGSGYPLLDAEVTELIARASPLPPPPAGAARSYVVPIVFALR